MSSKSQQFRKSVQITNGIRKFHTTRCPTCGNIDGIIEQIENYDPKRVLYEWAREGRAMYEHIQKGKEQIPFCICIPSDDPKFENKETRGN
jgi:hypothetical protein